MNTRMQRTALFAALLAIGLAGGVHAQSAGSSSRATSGSSSTGTTGTTATQSPGKGSAATTGTMDKGAGTAAAVKSSDAKLAGGERRFIETAARHGMAEVQLGKMAQDKAQDPGIKDYGRRMVQDHGKANDQLRTLAPSKGVTLPAETDAAHKRLADRLAKLSGAEFDRVYVKEMVDDHQKDVKEFRDMSRTAKDADVKSFATANLPVLEEHLKMAQGLKKKGSASASASQTGGGTSASAQGAGASASASAMSKSGSGSATSTATGDKK